MLNAEKSFSHHRSQTVEMFNLDAPLLLRGTLFIGGRFPTHSFNHKLSNS